MERCCLGAAARGIGAEGVVRNPRCARRAWLTVVLLDSNPQGAEQVAGSGNVPHGREIIENHRVFSKQASRQAR